jgi:hypothetical protein
VQPSGKDEVSSTIRGYEGSPAFAQPRQQFVTKSDPEFWKGDGFFSSTVGAP